MLIKSDYFTNMIFYKYIRKEIYKQTEIFCLKESVHLKITVIYVRIDDVNQKRYLIRMPFSEKFFA